MKINYLIAFIVFAFASLALAATNAVDPLTAPLPQTTAQFWDFAIAGLTPIIVWFFRKLVPTIPTIFVPFTAAAIGMGLALLLNKAGAANYSWYDAGKAGLLAIAVRECFSQAVTKGLIKRTSTKVVKAES